MTDPLELDDYTIASAVASKAWAVALPALRSTDPRPRPAHFPGALDRAFIEQAPLPLGPNRGDSQTVALVDADRFDRRRTNSSIDAGYRSRPRTKIYEGIDAHSDGWYSVVALQLARLARCRVVCTMYESRSGDLNLGAHVDEWFGIVIQVHGEKGWKISIPPDISPMSVTTKTGDILLLPPQYEHEVSTLHESTHLVFALITEESIR